MCRYKFDNELDIVLQMMRTFQDFHEKKSHETVVMGRTLKPKFVACSADGKETREDSQTEKKTLTDESANNAAKNEECYISVG